MLSTVTCGHPPGKVQTQSLAKLKVNGSPVLLQASINGKPVIGCSTPPASDPSGVTAKPCTSVSAVSAGAALKLKINGQPAMLATLQGSTDGMVAKVTPQSLLAGVANQSKLQTV
jgi:hypothetical protein